MDRAGVEGSWGPIRALGRGAALAILIAFVPGCAQAAHAFFESLQEPPEQYQVALEKSVRVPMRDGIRLSTDIYRPAGLSGHLLSG